MAHSRATGDEQLAPEGGRKPPRSGPASNRTRQLEYARALRAPMVAIRAEIRRGIIARGIFDRVIESGTDQLAPSFDPSDLTPATFRFTDPDTAHERFMAWLRREQSRGVLSTISRNDNIYIRRALTDGDRWAIARMREAGIDVAVNAAPAEAYAPQALSTTVSRASLGIGFDRAIPASTVRLLYERNYSLLEGITTDTSREIAEVLSQGFAQGKGSRQIGREIAGRVDAVGLNRATAMARYEVMNAHNQSAKHRFRQQGVERVKVLGTDPCEVCAPRVGSTYSIEELPRGGPPWHPSCVCCIAPVA